MRSAQSIGITAVVSVAMCIETSGLHLILASRHPWLAWTLTLSSVSALWWLIGDHRAMATSSIRITAEHLEGEIGKRTTFSVPTSRVASVERPRLMPVAGPPRGYLNITKPSSANVLIVFREPVPLKILGVARPVTQLALHLDDADRFLQGSSAWVSPRPTA